MGRTMTQAISTKQGGHEGGEFSEDQSPSGRGYTVALRLSNNSQEDHEIIPNARRKRAEKE